MRYAITLLVCLGAVLLGPRAGQAQEAGTGGQGSDSSLTGAPRGVSVAALLGYTFDLVPGGLNPYALSLGARAGVTLEQLPIYIGGSSVFYVGDTEAGTTVRMVQLGAEAGYDFLAGPVILRPWMGLGMNVSFLRTRAVIEDVETTEADFFLAFGGTVIHQLTPTWFVGGELRYTVAFTGGENFDGIGALATGGARF